MVLRALQRVHGRGPEVRNAAAPIADAFRHLSNLPDVRARVESKKQRAYWLAVARYAAKANLQAVMDEYTHVHADEPLIEVRDTMIAALTLRASRVTADLFASKPRGVKPDGEFHFACRFAMRFGVDDASDDGTATTRSSQVRTAFNSPFWPFVLATTSVGQEGLDFHRYCHAVVHWNLPSNPVDLEQREGRVHRYKGHAVRKNHVHRFRPEATDPWQAVFDVAIAGSPDDPHLRAFWLAADGMARIERHVPAYPQSRDGERLRRLQKELVLYRMAFGQNRQEDLVRFLARQLDPSQIEQLRLLCRIDLRPGLD